MNNELLTNQIYKNIFTEEEIKDIYSVINIKQTESTSIVPIYSQKAWHVHIPENVKNTITNFAKKVYKQNVKLEEISFARYSNDYGVLPNLTPHFDNTFLQQRVTVDVQLKANIDWPIVVEGKSFTLKDNEAVTFSGTHQIHWREHRKFFDIDFVEMLFCHFSLEEKKEITIEEKCNVESKMSYFTNRFSFNLMEQIEYYQNKLVNKHE